MPEELTAEELLLREIAGLPVDEILALCYAFATRHERLRLYMDVLRRRGGQRAQFAACLICFDLARQGDTSLQSEFAFLAGTIREVAADAEFVHTLVGDDQYLTFIWELLEAQLDSMDARFDTEHTIQTTHPEAEEVAALDLLSDDDFVEELADFDLMVDEPALQAAFDRAIDTFLGKIPSIPAYDPEAGFRLGHRRDTDRIERFLLDLESLREPVPSARAFRAITLLFYGTHMRSKSLFGAVNQRKQRLLREGLREFMVSGELVWQIAGVLEMHANPGAWPKTAEVLLDFTHWCGRRAPGPINVNAYDAVERQIERDRKRPR